MAAGTRSSKEQSASTKEVKSTASSADKSSSKDDSTSTSDAKGNAITGEPLGPPPRPVQSTAGDPDYFGQAHNGASSQTYRAEPNPFEAQFGNPATDTPGKLPGVSQLTSPQSLLPGDTPGGWGFNTLRSGPLSPAMLNGPAGGSDYFALGHGFPTPNESSMRTGLTPGGGGSMFPTEQPSPNTQAFLGQMQLGINTPNMNEFIRTGISAKAATNGAGPTSQPTEETTQAMQITITEPTAKTNTDAFSHPDADAASGLYMLAQSNGARPGNQFAVSSQPSNAQASSSVASEDAKLRMKKDSIASLDTNEGLSSSEESEEVVKRTTRSRGKKPAETKANGRKRGSDAVIKIPVSSKRQKANAAALEKMEFDDDDDDDAPNHKDSKKMTDEEKRKNFLERNRVAALKCRQRKKQWLASLQQKCELYGQENDALSQHVNQLREQVNLLKSILLQHKDCPVLQSQPIMQQALASALSGPVDMSMGYQVPTTANQGNGAVGGLPLLGAATHIPPR